MAPTDETEDALARVRAACNLHAEQSADNTSPDVYFMASSRLQYADLRALLARLERVEGERDQLRIAANAVVAKLDVIHDDPKYQAVWQLAAAHQYRYNGPDYVAELRDLRAALDAARATEGT